MQNSRGREGMSVPWRRSEPFAGGRCGGPSESPLCDCNPGSLVVPNPRLTVSTEISVALPDQAGHRRGKFHETIRRAQLGPETSEEALYTGQHRTGKVEVKTHLMGVLDHTMGQKDVHEEALSCVAAHAAG